MTLPGCLSHARAPRRSLGAGFLAIAAWTTLGTVPRPAQAQTFIVTGTVRSSTGLPIQGALVLMDSVKSARVFRSTAAGRFQFSGVPSGVHNLEVEAFGYHVVERDFTVGDADLNLDIVLTPRGPQPLDSIVVRAERTGVFGIIANAEDLTPVSRVRVQVIGAAEATTDSAGRYDMPRVKSGSYVVRLSREGFADKTWSISVARNKGYEFSALLSPSSEGSSRHAAAIWKDMDLRVHEGGAHTYLVPRSELGTNPRGDLSLYMARSRSMLIKNDQSLLSSPCIFVDGRPVPGFPLWSFSVGDVEAVEVYGMGTRQGRQLQDLWPRSAPCSDMEISPLMPGAVPLDQRALRGMALRPLGAQVSGSSFVLIWLRR
jgi:Carboxypeptidase regulatory-like domain